ncbi:MAG: hypothetical protein OEZ06_28290 [Myxococcales bacterium]|nr:hypothetical protein [Myxococcales bacterium]
MTRVAVGRALLLLQLAWFVYAQTGERRYFCWAPLHEHVFYRIEARVAGRPLDARALSVRYGRRNAFFDSTRGQHWELNAAAHVIDSIVWRERSLPPPERAEVTLRYRVNDGEARTWTFAP